MVINPAAAAEPAGPLGPPRAPGGAEGAGLCLLVFSAASPTPSAVPSLTPNNLLASPGLCFPAVTASGTPGSLPGPSWVLRLTAPTPRPPPPTRVETGVKGNPRHVVAEQHRIGRESRGRIRVEAEKSSPDSSAWARPGLRPGALAARWPAARAPGADLRSAPTPHHRIEPRSHGRDSGR